MPPLLRLSVLLLIVVLTNALSAPVSFQPFGAAGVVSEIVFLQDSNFLYVAGLSESSNATVLLIETGSYTELVTFDAGVADSVFFYPSLQSNTLALVVVSSGGTQFFILNSVLDVLCNNTIDLVLKSNSLGSAGLGFIVGEQLWFLDPSVVDSTRNLFWNVDMISCNVSQMAVSVAHSSFVYSVAVASNWNVGIVLAAGMNNGRSGLATLEFAASNSSILISTGALLLNGSALPPVGLTLALETVYDSAYTVALPPCSLVEWSVLSAWNSQLGSTQLPVPEGHAFTRTAANSASTFVATTHSSEGGGLAEVDSTTMALSAFVSLNATQLTGWRALAASDEAVCGQPLLSSITCWEP